MKNIGIFASHGGSNLQAIIDAEKSCKLNAKVAVVISNNRSAFALERAGRNGIPSVVINGKDPCVVDARTLDVLREYHVDIVMLVGYLKKIGPGVLSAFEGNIYNIHPSLLPKYGGKGMHGLNVHHAVLDAGERETGVTIHRVSAEYDEGAIIAQRKVPVVQGDSPESLSARVLKTEHVMLVEVLQELVL